MKKAGAKQNSRGGSDADVGGKMKKLSVPSTKKHED